MYKLAKHSLFIFLLLIVLSCCNQYYPTDTWRTATPEDQKMDSKLLQAFSDQLRNGELGYIDDMLVIRNGYLVFFDSYTNDYETLYQATNTTPGQYN